MTNPPTAADLIARAVPCIEYLVSQGCPGMPDHVELYMCSATGLIPLLQGMTGYFDDQGKLFITSKGVLRNDPAVLDSIVVWVAKVCMWLQSEDELHLPDMPQLIIDRIGDPYWMSKEWPEGTAGRLHDDYEEATIALLEAITEAVKGGSAND